MIEKVTANNASEDQQTSAIPFVEPVTRDICSWWLVWMYSIKRAFAVV
jgi:hypothetical protein